MAGRRPVTALGKLFGSDTLFEVLDAVAKRGPQSFTPSDLVPDVKATPAAIGTELAKLEGLGVLEQRPDAEDGRLRPYRAGGTKLADHVLKLPNLIRSEIEHRPRV